MQDNLHTRAYAALMADPVQQKLDQARTLRADWRQGRLSCGSDGSPPQTIATPGRPDRPVLVSPLHMARRSVRSPQGHAALIHAIAHIEFNAINLALDAVYRFRGMPADYYADWLQVAEEEAYHFSLLRDHLRSLGHDYGDFEAHDGLWQMALQTAHDPLVRMALVPRVLEARGLDASPALARKFEGIGDRRAVEILGIILRDEIGHVRIGNRWYGYLCQQRGVDPMRTFQELLQEYGGARLRPPLHTEARRAAGFSEEELAVLESLAQAAVAPGS
jgi:uncharacterized ferritin-like protein (DUF455 family)